MPQYKPSDDGKVVEGRVVVYMTGAAQSKALVDKSAKAEVAKATVAMLQSAAAHGVGVCEECEAARRDLEAMRKAKLAGKPLPAKPAKPALAPVQAAPAAASEPEAAEPEAVPAFSPAAEPFELTHPRWSAESFEHGDEATMTVDASGPGTVRFDVERRVGTAWEPVQSIRAAIKDGKATAVVQLKYAGSGDLPSDYRFHCQPG